VASGVAFDATHDANFVAHFVAKSSHTSSAAYAANRFPRSSAKLVRSCVWLCA
jgi:hypothetical protein